MLAAPLAWAQGAAKNAVESINFSSIQGGKILVKVGLEGAAGGRAAGLRRHQSAAHRDRPSRHRQRHGPHPDRSRRRRPAQRLDRADRQPHAPGDEPHRATSPTRSRSTAASSWSRSTARRRPTVGRRGRHRALGAAPTVFAEAGRPAARFATTCATSTSAAATPREGRVVVDLSSANIGIDIRQQGRQLAGRLHQHQRAAQPRAPPRRGRLRHAGALRRHLRAGRQRAHGDRAARPVGILGLPDRHPVHRRGEAGQGRPEPPGAELHPGLRGREALAQLPERRSARGAAGDRGLHGPEHHHQRHGGRQPHAAPEGRALGPGARHHPAGQGTVEAQERQRGADRADRRARRQGEARPRGASRGLRPGAGAHRVLRALLRQGRGPEEAALRQGPEDPVQARQRHDRRAHQHALRAGLGRAPRRGPPPDPAARRPGAPGADRGAHRDRRRQVGPPARRALRHAVGVQLAATTTSACRARPSTPSHPLGNNPVSRGSSSLIYPGGDAAGPVHRAARASARSRSARSPSSST